MCTDYSTLVTESTLSIGGSIASSEFGRLQELLKEFKMRPKLITSANENDISSFCVANNATYDFCGFFDKETFFTLSERLQELHVDFNLEFPPGDLMGERALFRKGMKDPVCIFIDAEGFDVMSFDTIHDLLVEAAEEGASPTHLPDMLTEIMGDNVPELTPFKITIK